MKLKPLLIVASLCLAVGTYALFLSTGDSVKVADKSTTIQQQNVFVEMNTEELFGYADIVAVGKIKKISDPKETTVRVGDEEKFMIYKDYTLEVKEAYKGIEPGVEVIVRVPGGELGKTVFVSDAAAPDKVKDQVLFLKKWPWDESENAFDILGGPQGVYIIEDNKAKNIEKAKDLETFKSELKDLKGKIGDQKILPPGFEK